MTLAQTARRAGAIPAATLLLVLAGCNQSQQQAGGPPPPAVTVAKPVQRTVIDQDEYVGRFAAVDSVEIRSRLSGYLSDIHFKDGQMVKQGDLLFTIDRRPFEIALEQMRANLAQARANLAFTEADLARGQSLLTNKTITEQAYDQRTQAKAVATASVTAQEAMVHSAELDLDQYSQLRSPIDGRIGDRRVAAGNLVTGGAGANTTLLATVVSVDPIRFEFTFDEQSYLRYVRYASASKEVAALNGNVPVSLELIDENEFKHIGKIDFVDNAINTSTGTIRGRAVFDNADGIFTPGMFGRLRVPGSPPYTALLLPDAAIGSEQVRKYVLVVDDSGMVQQKYVTLGQLDGGLRVIKDGLDANDRVIVNGLMRARPGIKVNAQEQAAPAAPAAAAPAKTGDAADGKSGGGVKAD
ncbi:MAG TPA: efflux RND transporter periplasmic adaptor subunit [Xanthobacteraceae bacterium]|jgi:RND family efflux transporter MFP subunit|nr:efflux RND transporter periplasmic adaptor subunit [Xanthobacteraceae bacterium]